MATSKRLHLKIALIENLVPQLIEYGFSLKRSEERFVRKFDGFSQFFGARCTDARPGYWAAPQLGVRTEQVETIFHQTSGFERKYQRWTPTIGSSVGGYLGSGEMDCRFLMEKEDDVLLVSEQVMRVFHEFAVPYFNRYDSLAAVEEALNGNPTALSNHALEWFRCSKGLILARLLDRPYFRQLLEIYTEIMRRDNKGFYFGWFQALVASLDEVEPLANLPERPAPLGS